MFTLVVNPFGWGFVTAMNSQEIVLYHLNDIVTNTFADSSAQDDYYLATGTYEQQKKGPMFGLGAGHNLIIVQIEAMQNMLINKDYFGQEITPCLNELIRDPSTIYFDNFYQQIGSGNTSDAEFAVNNSMIGTVESYTYKLFENNYFKGLPWLLKEKGYTANVFHGFANRNFWNRENIYPALGWDRFYSGDTDYKNDNIKGIGAGNITGISDHAFLQQTVEHMKSLPQPFYNFVITLSSHNPFGLPDSLSEIDIRPQEDNIVGDYINAEHYADKCIGEFMQELKDAGLYDSSIIVFYGDHFGLSKADRNIDKVVSNWLGHEYTYDNMLNIPLLIHMPGQNVHQTVSVSGGQTDIMPTLAYLMGFETLDTVYFGQNLLTAREGFVPMQTHLLKGSFIKGDVVFEMSRDGIFENSRAWNRKTREEIPISGLRADSLKAKKVIEMSSFYLYNDVLRLVLERGMSFEKVLEKLQGKDVPIPQKTGYIYIKRGDYAKMQDFYEYVTGTGSYDGGKGLTGDIPVTKYTGDKRFFLDSDDITGLLLDMQTGYSGKSGDTGTITVDETVAGVYKKIQQIIIPVDREGLYTKIEYMGYSDIAYMPPYGREANSENKEYVKLNRPCAVLLPHESLEAAAAQFLSLDSPVFVMGNEAKNGRQYQKKWGTYGTVEIRY